MPPKITLIEYHLGSLLHHHSIGLSPFLNAWGGLLWMRNAHSMGSRLYSFSAVADFLYTLPGEGGGEGLRLSLLPWGHSLGEGLVSLGVLTLTGSVSCSGGLTPPLPSAWEEVSLSCSQTLEGGGRSSLCLWGGGSLLAGMGEEMGSSLTASLAHSNTLLWICRYIFCIAFICFMDLCSLLIPYILSYS